MPLKISKINFLEQNIETGLTKSHSRSRKTFAEVFKKSLNFPELKKESKFPEFP